MTYRAQARRALLAERLAEKLHMPSDKLADALAECEREGLVPQPTHKEP